MNVRLALSKDIDFLLSLESECWDSHLRASRDELLRRIAAFPQGQFVIEIDGIIFGVLYTQRICTIDALKNGSFKAQFDLHRPDGSIIQLLAIAVRSYGGQNLAAVLRNYALQKARESGIFDVVAMTRCGRFRPYLESLATSSGGNSSVESSIDDPLVIKSAYMDYVYSYKDPTIFFHKSGGANILEMVHDYREEDIANCGYAVLIHYDVMSLDLSASSACRQEIADISSNRNSVSSHGELSTLICAQIQKITQRFEPEMAPSKTDPFMTILDSLGLLILHSWLEEYLSIKLDSTFLFNHFTALLVEDRLVRGFRKESLVSSRIMSNRCRSQCNDIAIVGVALKFPREVLSLGALWKMLVTKSTTFSEVPFDRFDVNSLDFQAQFRDSNIYYN